MESEFLAWLRDHLPDHPRFLLGPGDDAAVLQLSGDRCVVTSDMLNDGTDFVSGQSDWRLVGRKALAVNLSDLAAMAARPVAALVSLLLPRHEGLLIAQSLYGGLLALAAEFDLPVAGGDTNSWDGPTVISVTAIGQTTPHGFWRRSGACPGDQILVTGSFGGSILGRQFEFVPRVREALKLNAEYRIHAATDVSDGLSLDLSHLLQASGCGAELRLDWIPVSDDARRLAASAEGPGESALDHALGDGEDFELILAVPADEAERLLADQPLDVPLSRIGQFIADSGLWQIAESTGRQPLVPRGYQH
jgi:thiamine-monophosphate kinase